MDFDEGIAAVGVEAGDEIADLRGIEERRQEQDRAGTCSDAANELGLIDDEVFHQDRKLIRGSADPFARSVEELRLGNDGDCRGAAGFVLGGDRFDIRVVDNRPCRWGCGFDLGDDVDAVFSQGRGQSEGGITRDSACRRRFRAEARACAGDDFVEDGHGVRASSPATGGRPARRRFP